MNADLKAELAERLEDDEHIAAMYHAAVRMGTAAWEASTWRGEEYFTLRIDGEIALHINPIDGDIASGEIEIAEWFEDAAYSTLSSAIGF